MKLTGAQRVEERREANRRRKRRQPEAARRASGAQSTQPERDGGANEAVTDFGWGGDPGT